MKIQIKIILMTICMLCVLTSCAGAGDWKFTELPKDYSIWRNNSRSISLCREVDETSANTVIEAYVSEIAYNESYIFAKQVSVPKDSREKIDTANPDYYIVVVDTEEVFGPYAKADFDLKCVELEINDLPEWIVTTKLKNK